VPGGVIAVNYYPHICSIMMPEVVGNCQGVVVGRACARCLALRLDRLGD
jgi:hypothetical protein